MDLKLVGKFFLPLKPVFSSRFFRVFAVLPRRAGGFFLSLKLVLFDIFCICSLSGQVSLTSNAPCFEWGPCLFEREVPPLRQTNRQTFYSRSRLVKGVLCVFRNVPLPVAYIDGVEETISLTNSGRCSYLFGSKGPLFWSWRYQPL